MDGGVEDERVNKLQQHVGLLGRRCVLFIISLPILPAARAVLRTGAAWRYGTSRTMVY